MEPSLRTLWANTSTATKVVSIPLFTVFSAMVLITCGGFMGQVYSASYTNLGEDIFAIFAGIVSAVFVPLIMGVFVIGLLGFAAGALDEYSRGNNNVKRTIRVLCVIYALFFVANLSSEHGIFWRIYMDIQTSMDGGFVALCSAITGATLVNMVAAQLFAILLVVFGFIIRGVADICFD